MDDDRADFVLLPVDGPASYGRLSPGESTYQAIRRQVPDLGTQGAGRLRLWFPDQFRDASGRYLFPPNPLADRVVSRLGYRLAGGWYGPVAISMEEETATGEIPPLSPEVRATIDELTAQNER